MPAAVAKSTHGPFSIPSLDGLRFIAVMVVFIGHGATAPGIWPGHVGVTIFFFLSGYLITTLLRREYDRNDRISLGNFYLRRALRILPPAYITIALAVFVGQLGILSSTQNIWGVLAEMLNVTNYYMIFADSSFGDAYRGLPPETSMLWSLAVEEHFYLLFPAVLILMLRRHLTYRRIGWILVAMCVLILGWRIVVAFGDPSFFRIYTASDVRFDGLLAGAALALLWNPALGDPRPLRISDRVLKFWLAPIALALGVTVTMLPSAVRLTLSDSIVYICLVPIFWLVISFPEGLTGRFLNSRVVAHIGVLSFSIYLLHRLVIALVELVISVPLVSDVCALFITLALAQIMYVAVERPAGRVRKRLEARLTLARRPRSEDAHDGAPATDAPRA